MNALVARSGETGLQYLAGPSGNSKWVTSTFYANHFQDIRSATRAALKLPARLRAFALPQYDDNAGR
jgi:hypothetical protein